jgi:hypothetical protein
MLIALTIPEWGGVGIYPYWKWADKELYGGLHLDIRPENTGSNKIIWWRDKEGRYRYIHHDDKYCSNQKELIRILASESHI